MEGFFFTELLISSGYNAVVIWGKWEVFSLPNKQSMKDIPHIKVML
jgi:hypothetical protein